MIKILLTLTFAIQILLLITGMCIIWRNQEYVKMMKRLYESEIRNPELKQLLTMPEYQPDVLLKIRKKMFCIGSTIFLLSAFSMAALMRYFHFHVKDSEYITVIFICMGIAEFICRMLSPKISKRHAAIERLASREL